MRILPRWLSYKGIELATFKFNEQGRFSFSILKLSEFSRGYSLFDVTLEYRVAQPRGHVLRFDLFFIFGIVRKIQSKRFYKRYYLADDQLKHLHLYLGEFLVKKAKDPAKCSVSTAVTSTKIRSAVGKSSYESDAKSN